MRVNHTGGHGGALRHEALLYAGDDEYLAGTADFLLDGHARDELLVALVTPDRLELLRGALGPVGDRVHWVDITQVGRNPTRLISAWHQFIDENLRPGRRLRGIGQPVWPGRSTDEMLECHHHESLVNLSFADVPAWVRCPYDTAAFDQVVIDQVHRSHPGIVQRGDRWESAAYGGASEAWAALLAPLPAPGHDPDEIAVDPSALRRVRRFVADRGAAAGLSPDRIEALVFAVNELATNSVQHGGGHGRVRTWTNGGTVVGEVTDRGRIEQPLVGRRRPAPGQTHGRGLWIVNELSDLVQLRSSADGTTVRVHVRRY